MVAFGKTGVVMSEKKRKVFSGEFKAKVALEAIRNIKTANEIAQEFGVHPTQVQNTCPLSLTQAVGVKGEQLINQRCAGHMTMKNG